MDALFSLSTSRTVWRSLVQRRSTADIVQERRQEIVIYDKKEEARLEQVESVDPYPRH